MTTLREIGKASRLPVAIGLVIAPLTWFVWEGGSRAIANVLMLPLFPGLMAGLFITGGHGGTHAQDIAALFASITVNVTFYTGLIRLAGYIESRRAPLADRVSKTIER